MIRGEGGDCKRGSGGNEGREESMKRGDRRRG